MRINTPFFNKTLFVIFLCLLMTKVVHGSDGIDIRELGAKGDGKTLCTKAIQEAVDKCAKSGGGTVRLPAGTWLTGTIYMKDNVTLWLDAGCKLLGSTKLEDYPENVPSIRSYSDRYVNRSLIAGEGLKNIAIRGRGIIDGQGATFIKDPWLKRPYVIRFVKCSDVLVEGIRLQQSPMWMQHYLACDRVKLHGVTVFNRCGRNNDALDIDACSDVCVSDCNFDSDDDAITLKSTLERPCENVVITNCVASSHSNGIKVGTETHGGFKNITISNCTIFKPSYERRLYDGRQQGLAGIALEIVDGGHLDRITINNIIIRGVRSPIFVRLGNRGRLYKEGIPKPDVGTLRNVTISNIVATEAGHLGCIISGIPGHAIENLILDNIQLTFTGGGTAEHAKRIVPENEDGYPECTRFGILPAYGFYCRHVNGLTMSNIRLRTEKPDLRHALVFNDVRNANISGLDARSSSSAEAMISLKQVQDILIRGCQPATSLNTFLKLEGDKCSNVSVLANVFTRVKNVADTGPNVPKGTLSINGNSPSLLENDNREDGDSNTK